LTAKYELMEREVRRSQVGTDNVLQGVYIAQEADPERESFVDLCSRSLIQVSKLEALVEDLGHGEAKMDSEFNRVN
jgi:hypothetical protein